MPFVTKLTLESGDRETLDRVVDQIKRTAEQKGVEFKGPASDPTTTLRVPLPKRLPGDGEYDPWRYSVYSRTVRIVGHDDFARETAQGGFPRGVHVDVEVEQVKQPGHRSS